MQCVGKVDRLALLASANRQELAFLIRLLLPIGLDAGRSFPKAPAKFGEYKTDQTLRINSSDT